MFTLADQPQSIGKVLDSGFRLYGAGFRKFIGLASLYAVVMIVPALLVPVQPGRPPDPARLRLFGAVVLVMIPLYIFFYTALLYRIGMFAQADDPGFAGALKRGLRYVIPALVSSVLAMLAVVGGLIALVVPGVILMVGLFFSTFAIVLDGAGPLAALRRSFNLVWGNWWRTAAIMTVAFVVMMVFSFGVKILPLVVVAIVRPEVSLIRLVNMITEVIANAVVAPLLWAMLVVHYYDLKLRKEGHDLEERLSGVAVRAPT